MRILVVADIHGNRAAIESIREPFDVCLCLGDLVDYGPEPGPCIDWVRKNAAYCVRGNHDHGVAQDVEVQGVGGYRFLTAVTRPLSVTDLTTEHRRFLADLPTSQMFTLGGKRFLMVHATPRDPIDEYAPPEPEFWKPRVAGLGVDYVLAGHTHQQYSLQINGTTIINPGSVGLTRDGDPRAAYAVIDDGEIHLQRIAYPIEETVAALEERIADPNARKLLTETYRGGGLVAKWAQVHQTNGANGHGATKE